MKKAFPLFITLLSLNSFIHSSEITKNNISFIFNVIPDDKSMSEYATCAAIESLISPLHATINLLDHISACTKNNLNESTWKKSTKIYGCVNTVLFAPNRTADYLNDKASQGLRHIPNKYGYIKIPASLLIRFLLKLSGIIAFKKLLQYSANYASIPMLTTESPVAKGYNYLRYGTKYSWKQVIFGTDYQSDDSEQKNKF